MRMCWESLAGVPLALAAGSLEEAFSLVAVVECAWWSGLSYQTRRTARAQQGRRSEVGALHPGGARW